MLVEQEFATPGDALMHFGIKGMRWGVRSSRDSEVAHVVMLKQRGSDKTQELIAKTHTQSAKHYKRSVAKAAGAYYLNKKGHTLGATVLAVGAVRSVKKGNKARSAARGA